MAHVTNTQAVQGLQQVCKAPARNKVAVMLEVMQDIANETLGLHVARRAKDETAEQFNARVQGFFSNVGAFVHLLRKKHSDNPDLHLINPDDDDQTISNEFISKTLFRHCVLMPSLKEYAGKLFEDTSVIRNLLCATEAGRKDLRRGCLVVVPNNDRRMRKDGVPYKNYYILDRLSLARLRFSKDYRKCYSNILNEDPKKRKRLREDEIMERFNNLVDPCEDINIQMIVDMDHEPDHLDPKHRYGDEANESNVLINLLLTPKTLNHHQLFKDCYAREKEGSLFVLGPIKHMWTLSQNSGGAHSLKVSQLVYEHFMKNRDTQATVDDVSAQLKRYDFETGKQVPRRAGKLLTHFGQALDVVRRRLYDGSRTRSYDGSSVYKKRMDVELARMKAKRAAEAAAAPPQPPSLPTNTCFEMVDQDEEMDEGVEPGFDYGEMVPLTEEEEAETMRRAEQKDKNNKEEAAKQHKEHQQQPIPSAKALGKRKATDVAQPRIDTLFSGSAGSSKMHKPAPHPDEEEEEQNEVVLSPIHDSDFGDDESSPADALLPSAGPREEEQQRADTPATTPAASPTADGEAGQTEAEEQEAEEEKEEQQPARVVPMAELMLRLLALGRARPRGFVERSDLERLVAEAEEEAEQQPAAKKPKRESRFEFEKKTEEEQAEEAEEPVSDAAAGDKERLENADSMIREFTRFLDMKVGGRGGGKPLHKNNKRQVLKTVTELVTGQGLCRAKEKGNPTFKKGEKVPLATVDVEQLKREAAAWLPLSLDTSHRWKWDHPLNYVRKFQDYRAANAASSDGGGEDPVSDEEEEEEQAEEPATTKKKRWNTKDHVPQSEVEGVHYQSKFGMWYGSVYDKLQRKNVVTSTFKEQKDAEEAHAVFKARVDAEFLAQTTKWANEDELCRDLPMGPEHAEEALEKTAYWRPNERKNHRPFKAVRINDGDRTLWKQACVHVGCAKRAISGKNNMCKAHHKETFAKAASNAVVDV